MTESQHTAEPDISPATDAPTSNDEGHFRTFLIVWSGQLVSLIGSSLTWFGLSVWVFLETGSVTALSVMLLASTLPRILLSPIAGAYVDRWDRRWVMLGADALTGVGTLVIVVAFMTGTASLGVLVVVGAFASAFQAFQWPAYQAATTMLVPKERYSQASGMVQMAEAAGQLVAPFLGGVLIAFGGVATLLAVDVATFLFAVFTLAIVRFPKPPKSEVGEASKGSIWKESAFGFTYLWHRHGLFALLIFFAMLNLTFGLISPVFIAYMLSWASEATMGTVLSLGATGMLVGSIVASARKVTSRRVAGIMLSTVVLGAMLLVIGFSTWIVVIVGTLWIGMFVVPIATAMSQSIWMSKVEPDVQGRVFGVRSLIAQGTQPLALAIAGPLADKVFVPLLSGDSDLGEWAQGLFGTGERAGYAAMFAAIGVYTIVMSGLAYLYGPLRNLETEIPDAEGLPTEVAST
ncbi:MAG: MFS transporter [Acidimicrobiia bacterium]